MGTIPIYRRQDASGERNDDSRRQANRNSLDALASAIAGGSFAALFPEGVSHDAPYLQELRTGAASLYVRALALTGTNENPPVILPVGLHYDAKQIFGSNALVAYHPAIELDAELRSPLPEGASRDQRHQRYAAITRAMDRALTSALRPTESWDLHRAMHRARSLMRAERAARTGTALPGASMAERVLGFSRLWEGHRTRASSHPRETRQLLHRVLAYDADLRALGLKDRELDGNPRRSSPWRLALLLLQVLLVYVVLPPLLLAGLIINTPTALAILLFTKSVRKSYKDEASVKLLVGAVAFPVTWVVTGALVAYAELRLHQFFPVVPEAPVLTGILAFLLSAAGAWVVLHYQRLFSETGRAVRVRLTRARQRTAIKDLRAERGILFQELCTLSEGLELPGRIAPDGRILPDDASAG
jgi:hypothetical protein